MSAATTVLNEQSAATLRKTLVRFHAMQLVLLAVVLLLGPMSGHSFATRTGRLIAWVGLIPLGLSVGAYVYYRRVTGAAKDGTYTRDLDARELKRIGRGLLIALALWGAGAGVIFSL